MTAAQNDLLDRARSVREAQELIDIARPALVKATDFGVQLFGQILGVQRQDEVDDQQLALVFPYLILIEMLDGVQVLTTRSTL